MQRGREVFKKLGPIRNKKIFLPYIKQWINKSQ